MKRILINATHSEEVRVALCKDSHLYDFDLENRTREQKKSNVYKGYVSRIEPSLEAVFVEYGSERQGFLPLREIAPEYLSGNPREDNIKKLIKEGDEVLVQVAKEERGNKGAALTTYISLAGRYLVLMPNNAKGGGISRQISGKVREDMRQIISDLNLPKNMSVIVRTAGIGKTFEDLQHDLSHLLETWQNIQRLNREQKVPHLMHQEASVVTRAMRDYLRDDIGEVWIDNEHAYNEAASFIASVMPTQMHKLRKYTDYEPMFAVFGIERQIETAYQREVRLPSGGSIVIDQTEALVSIDINSSKSTKGSDVAETAYHTNLEAAEEIARQLRLRDMGGLIVIDFIDMNDPTHQKNVEKRLIDATRYDRARVQFAEISKFGLLEMSRQRLRPSLEETTGYLCPRCHGNGIIRDLRSLSLSIMRQIEQLALQHRSGEIQAEVPTEIAAFLLNEKRESLVYLEQDSGVRVTILPHAHLESPNFSVHFNPDGFAPASYERIVDAEEQQSDRGYDVNWQTKQDDKTPAKHNHWQQSQSHQKNGKNTQTAQKHAKHQDTAPDVRTPTQKAKPQAVAWLSNLFAPKPQAKMAHQFDSQEVAAAIENIVNTGASSLGAFGQIQPSPNQLERDGKDNRTDNREKTKTVRSRDDQAKGQTKDHRPDYKKSDKPHKTNLDQQERSHKKDVRLDDKTNRREPNSRREPRAAIERGEALTPKALPKSNAAQSGIDQIDQNVAQADAKRDVKATQKQDNKVVKDNKFDKPNKGDGATSGLATQGVKRDFALHILPSGQDEKAAKVVHLSLDKSKAVLANKVALPNGDLPSGAVDTPSVQEPSTATTPCALATPMSVAINQKEQNADLIASQKVQAPKAFTHTPSYLDDKLLQKIALQYQLAKNDPRVVYEALQQQSSPKPKPITGTAGALIEQYLPNAKQQLAQQGFVACFIQALQLAKGGTNLADNFDFSNYGYLPLSEDYLGQFHQGIVATEQFAVHQGKTNAVPPPSVRAKNDPRNNEKNDDPKTNGLNDVSPSGNGSSGEGLSSDGSSGDTLGDDTVTAVSADVHSDDTPAVADVASVSAENLATQKACDEVEKVAQLRSEIIEQIEYIRERSVGLPNHILDGLADDLQAILPPNIAASMSETIAKEEEKAEKASKTKSDHYKDMIENIAEQLLPRMGILNLGRSKPSKAKVRIKKSKAEGSNKPKAQVVIKRKAKSDVPEE